MTSWSSKKIDCTICGQQINQGNRARHYKNNHPMYNPYKDSATIVTPVQRVIREGHHEENVKENVKEIVNENVKEHNENFKDNREYNQKDNREYNQKDNQKYNREYNENVNIEYKNINHSEPQKVIIKNFKDLETIRNVRDLNNRINQVIENFNGHIKKLYNFYSTAEEKISSIDSKKTNKSDIYKLENRINSFSSTIEGIRRTLGEQHKSISNIYNVYKHAKKQDNNYARQIQHKIEKTVNNSNTENVLKQTRIMIEAHKLSIERAYKLVDNITDDVSVLKTRLDGMDLRVKSVEDTNNIILKRTIENRKELQKFITEEDVVKIIKKYLQENTKNNNTKTDNTKNNNTKTDNTNNNTNNTTETDTNNTTESNTTETDTTDTDTDNNNNDSNKDSNNDSNKDSNNDSNKDSTSKVEKPLINVLGVSYGGDTNSFEKDIKNLLKSSRTKKNNDHYKYTIKAARQIVRKHASLGHLKEIEDFYKKTKNKIKKHIKTTIKNIKVKD